jgi:hypothetical protein
MPLYFRFIVLGLLFKVFDAKFLLEFASVGEVEFGEYFAADVADVIVVDAYAGVVVAAAKFEETAVTFAADNADKCLVAFKVFA